MEMGLMEEKHNQKYSKDKPYHVIAVCYARFHDDMSMEILKELVARSDEMNCKLIAFSTCSDLYFEEKSDEGDCLVFDVMDIGRFDAMIILTETFKDTKTVPKLVAGAEEAGVPVISIDKHVEGCYNIEFCYGNSFEKIVRHIVEEHHMTRVNFIAGMEGNSFSDERLECYKRVLQENGIPIEEKRIGYGDFWEGPAKDAVDDFLSSGLELPQAIICANDIMAIAVCQKLKEYGYRVPEDIVVTGFDGLELEKYHSPRLTTAAYNMDGLVSLVYKIIGARVRGVQIPKDYKLDYLFRKSCSCGCAPVELVDASDKVYQMAIRNKNTDFFDEQAYRMVLHLSNLDSLPQVFKEFETYARQNDSSYLWICTNNDMLDEHYDFNRAIKSNAKKKGNPFSEVMYIPIRKSRAKFFRGDRVACTDLVPHLESVLEENNFMLILALHAEELPIGYIAACFNNMNSMMVKPYHTLVVNFMHVLNNFKMQAERENYFSKDMLTNLYNRRGFYKYIYNVMEECVLDEKKFAVISIDMDNLKGINDFYGHKEGDYALQKISSAMLAAVNDGEYAARFGGDEFLIAFGAENAEERVGEIIQEIQKNLDEFNEMKKKDYLLGASFGSYVEVPVSKSKLDDYIKFADHAMYTEKARHKREKNREETV